MSLQKKIPIIIDTDPGIDDAVAITAALFDPSLDVKLITTVAGNVDIDKTTINTQKIISFLDKDIPIAKGAAKPLTRVLNNASHIHGHSGLDGFEFPDHQNNLNKLNAVEAIYELLKSSNEKITLVPIGPLTNIALLFSIYPECKHYIERIVLMGGSAGRGNHTPNAEFNIYVDPEAAKIVFHSGLPIVMCGLDVTARATLTPEIITSLPTMNQAGKMLHSLFQHYRGGSMKTGLKMHDLCAIAYLSDPSIFETKECYVDIETSSELTLGTTAVDIFNKFDKPANAKVCLDLDINKFRNWAVDSLKRAI